jgi:hypothetical protein
MALSFLTGKEKVVLVNCGAEDILRGNQTITLGMFAIVVHAMYLESLSLSLVFRIGLDAHFEISVQIRSER